METKQPRRMTCVPRGQGACPHRARFVDAWLEKHGMLKTRSVPVPSVPGDPVGKPSKVA